MNMVTRICNGKLLHYICLLVDYEHENSKAESSKFPLGSNLDPELSNIFLTIQKIDIHRHSHNIPTPPNKKIR